MIKKIAKKITPCAISAVLTAGIATSPISVYADELENPQATEEVETPTSTIEKTETNTIPEAKKNFRPPHLICQMQIQTKVQKKFQAKVQI